MTQQIGRCRECRHMSSTPAGFVEPFHSCQLAQGDNGSFKPGTLAYACDAELYSAQLCVHPDFGCVQFEPKDGGDATADTVIRRVLNELTPSERNEIIDRLVKDYHYEPAEGA